MELKYGGDGEMKGDDGASVVGRGISPADGLPIKVLDELRNKTLVINELLRHFWASYPVNSYAKATKLTKVKDALTTHFERFASDLHSKTLLVLCSMKSRDKHLTAEESALVQQLLRPIQSQFNAAIDKYTTELESRQRHQKIS